MDLSNCKRVVIKVGSSLLLDSDGETLRSGWLFSLVEDAVSLMAKGVQVVIVSSGSIALGRKRLGIGSKELKLEEKQAAASCGQVVLMEAYQAAFDVHKINTGQVLLTRSDSDDRRRYMNASNTLVTLLEAGLAPIVNENDTVTTQEIRVGDNDRLAARVAQMISADVLVLLSDVDGLYDRNPREFDDASHIPEVELIDDSVSAMAGGAGTQAGTGGMQTKIQAAHIAADSGCRTIIASGLAAHPIKAIEEGAKRTLFHAVGTPDTARKNWIAHGLNVTGTLVVDDGAANALAKGNSLLPAGVVSVEGAFSRGDAVEIKTKDGRVLGRGLVAYKSDDAQKIMGHHTDDIEKILSYSGRSNLIHRDDMVLF